MAQPAREPHHHGVARQFKNGPTTIHKDDAMSHSHSSRVMTTSAKAILALVGLGLAAACSDSISAPTRAVSFKHPAQFSDVVDVTTFRYDPAQGLLQRFGNHVLVVPAGGVCHP